MSRMRSEDYDEGYWERGEGSNYVEYGDDIGWVTTCAVLRTLGAHGHLLEVACAKGFFVRQALRFGFMAQGIDISEWAIDHAPPEVEKRVRLGNAVALPWDDLTFDTVCSWEFMEHVPEAEIDMVIREMLRVGRPEGLFVHRIGIELPGDVSHQQNDHTHVLERPREWWEDKFQSQFQMPRLPQVEKALDDAFWGRDWAGRFFAYEM